jgi:hypothetical protein
MVDTPACAATAAKVVRPVARLLLAVLVMASGQMEDDRNSPMGGAIGEGENHFILDIGWCAGNWRGSFPRTVEGWSACAALSIIRARSLRPSSALNARK